MSDVTLGHGQEITFDLDAITEREYRCIFADNVKQDDLDALMAKATGLTVEQLLDISKADTKRLWRGLIEKVRSPLADPKN